MVVFDTDDVAVGVGICTCADVVCIAEFKFLCAGLIGMGWIVAYIWAVLFGCILFAQQKEIKYSRHMAGFYL